jgi:hypothetical protein
LGFGVLSGSGVDRCAADLTAVSSGFIARLDIGELAQWGHICRDTRKTEAKTSCCLSLALALLVLRILTNHANHTATVNHLALVADLLYGRTNLHRIPLFSVVSSQFSVESSAVPEN